MESRERWQSEITFLEIVNPFIGKIFTTSVPERDKFLT